MGGRGSTRWRGYRKRRVVEDCLVLSLVPLRRAGLLVPGSARAALEWHNPRTGAALASATVVTELLDGGRRILSLGYVVARGDVSWTVGDAIVLEPIRPHLGGVRWLARCPGLPPQRCGRRVLKLYLPPGADRYRCRGCHDLTYVPVQEHDPRVDRLRREGRRALTRMFVGLQGGGRIDFAALDRTVRVLPRWAQPFGRPWPGPSDARLHIRPLSSEPVS